MGNDLGPVLLTGASGYLGRHVLANLEARGLAYVATSRGGGAGEPCDLSDAAAVRGLLERTAPSAVIHCAANVPKTAAAYGDSASADASVVMLKAVVDAASCPIVLTSSMTVYGAVADTPVEESSAHRPPAGYARGKWTAEQLLFERGRADDVALRLPGLFGFPRRSGVLYNAARAFLTRGRFDLTAPAEPWAAMTVTDAAEYLVRAATVRRGFGAQVVNVGYEGPFTVSSAVARIAAACGVEWRSPIPEGRPFAMCLRRLESCYGTLGVTFGQRLDEFVEVVRHDEGI